MKSSEEKKGFLSALIRLIRIDRDESEEELEVVSRTAMYLGMERSEFQDLLENPIKYSPP